MNLFDLARSDPGVLGLADSQAALSRSEVVTEVARRANALRALGLAPGTRLAVFADNAGATVLTYAAAVVAGIGTVFVNSHLSADEVHYIVNDADGGAIWADQAHAATARDVARRSGLTALIEEPGSDWTATVNAASADLPSLDRRAGGDLVYTSGTTGFPKGVQVSATTEVTIADAIDTSHGHHCAGLGPHLVVGPLYHSGPHAAVGLLLIGTPVVVAGRFDAETILRLIETNSIGTSVLVPTHFVRLLSLAPEVRQRYDVSSLQLVAQTGSTCPIDVKRAMIEWFGPIFRESYGASESGIITAITSPEWLERPGSTGRALPGFEILVLDDDNQPCSTGVDGALYFRDRTGRGIRYHNDPEKTRAAHLEPGVFTLGDRGHLDADGYLYVTGRTSDTVISGGVNIYPAECERVLLDHPDVLDAAVFGVPDAEMGQRLVGVVTCRSAVSPDPLIRYCRDRIAHYKVPRELHVIEEIPRNAMGKIDKRALMAEYST